MESFNDFYDIESPRTSERKIATIENSIHHSLLYNNESKNYNIYSYFLKILLWIMAVGVIACIIVVVLLVMKKLS